MTITRANAEAELVSRAKKKMELIGLVVTTVGTNADLNSPLAAGLRGLGIVPASPITVSDADFTTLGDADLDEFFDRAELRLLENIHGSIDLVDITSGPQKESLGQLATQLEKSIDSKQKRINDKYGDTGSGSAFSVSLDRVDGYSVHADEATTE